MLSPLCSGFSVGLSKWPRPAFFAAHPSRFGRFDPSGRGGKLKLVRMVGTADHGATRDVGETKLSGVFAIFNELGWRHKFQDGQMLQGRLQVLA